MTNNPLIAESLARQHQQELLAQAANARLNGRHRHPRHTRQPHASRLERLPWWVLSWRLRAGRTLIRAGESLAARGGAARAGASGEPVSASAQPGCRLA
jgi:hypothetical protein